MGKVTIFCLLISTVILLVTFGQGMGVLHGADVKSHLSWSLATLVAVLLANCIAMIHAAQSDRVIRDLRRALERDQSPGQGSPR